MRKIEMQMNQALVNGVNFSKDNTQVIFEGGEANIYLHGNHIAKQMVNGDIIVNKRTLAQFPTNTTKSRLRALGVNVTTKKGLTYLDGEVI